MSEFLNGIPVKQNKTKIKQKEEKEEKEEQEKGEKRDQKSVRGESYIAFTAAFTIGIRANQMG